MKKRKKSANKEIFHIKNFNKFSRIALCIVFFWFGILKVFGLSPAEPLVTELLKVTMPFIPTKAFCVFLGLLEVCIGILFLIPRYTKIIFTIVTIHMTTTVLPLFMLPHLTWSEFLTPTMAGQYIIKNIIIVALALTVVIEYQEHHT